MNKIDGQGTRHTDRQTGNKTYRHEDREQDIQIGRQRGNKTYRHEDREQDRRTDREQDIHTVS